MIRWLTALLVLAVPAQAEFVLQLPLGAVETYNKVETTLPALVPISPAEDGTVPRTRAPDTIRRTVWRMGGEQTLQTVTRTVLRQLETSGYAVVLNCVATACGGFDFRFGIDVVPEPEMFVDLRRFRFVTAKQSVSDNPGYVTFLISRSPVAVFVQLTEYAPDASRAPDVPLEIATTEVAEAAPDPGLVSIVLEGVEFEAGSTKIATDADNAIARLAEKLQAEPDLKVLLVGHSDMSGSLAGNVKVSRARAEAVRQRLIQDHGIAAGRLSSHGVGFLAPRASNETQEGRLKNRRVEAVFQLQ